MLAFLVAIVHCGINKYQGGRKVMISFDGKTAQNMYFFLNQGWSDALNDRYVYTDNQIVVRLLARTKKADPLKTQAASHACSEYEKRGYPRANKASV